MATKVIEVLADYVPDQTEDARTNGEKREGDIVAAKLVQADVGPCPFWTNGLHWGPEDLTAHLVAELEVDLTELEEIYDALMVIKESGEPIPAKVYPCEDRGFTSSPDPGSPQRVWIKSRSVYQLKIAEHFAGTAGVDIKQVADGVTVSPVLGRRLRVSDLFYNPTARITSSGAMRSVG